MSDPNLDYAAIRRNVEKGIHRERWMYRIIFFAMHVLFFVISMLAVWGTVLANAELRTMLFNSGSGAAVIVVLPTVLWAIMILSHVASLFTETTAGEKSLRERLLMRQVGEEILRKGLMEEGMLEKPKRRAAALQAQRIMLSDDGEFIPIDEEEPVEKGESRARTNHTSNS